jgi:ABC-type antimicrobial peptide transport system permease subunit
MNLFSLFEGTIGSIRSVFRHKQRSFSLVAGMILGAGILGGILIYTDILNEANFNSIVNGVDYEVRFDLKTTPKSTDNFSLQSIRDSIASDPLVDDAVIMYGQSRQKIVQTAGSYSSYTSSLRASFPDSSSTSNGPGNGPPAELFGSLAFLVNESDLSSSVIVTSLSESIFEGSFDFSNNGVVIPQTIADTKQLQVGSKTNITLYIDDDRNVPSQAQYNLTNVNINGIYRKTSSGGGLFASIFNADKIYLSMNIFDEHSALKSNLDKEQMGFIATKINPEQLSLSDSSKASAEIDRFINSIEKQYEGLIIGSNEINASLLGSQIFSVFIVLFDLFLTLPVFILGIYLITFGAQMALNDRKKEIAIFKIQGASSKQILRSVFGEIIVLIVIGSFLGYLISVFVGLSNSLAIGYGKFDFGNNFEKLTQAVSYLKFNTTAYMIIVVFGGGLLLLIGYHRSKGFIESEIASTLFKTTEKEQGFFFKYWVDYILFTIGTVSLFKALLNQYYFPSGQGIDLGIFGVIIIDIPGPIAFWLGGALIISRMARIIPSKIDKYILKLKALADVRIMIFADLRRRTVNTSRIALIIALAISFSVLASVQGTTHEQNIDRQVVWDVGADVRLKMSTNIHGSMLEDHIETLDMTEIESVLAIGRLSGEILNDPVNVYFTDADRYEHSSFFQSDSFIGSNVADGFSELLKETTVNALVGKSILAGSELNVGDKINLGVTLTHYNGSMFISSEVVKKITIVGSVDHAPGGITGNDVLLDYRFIQDLFNSTSEEAFKAYNKNDNTTQLAEELGLTYNNNLFDKFYPADTFLIKISDSVNSETIKTDIINKLAFKSQIFDVYTLSSKLDDAHDLNSSGFGIAGLLTSMFLISLLSATIGVFIFISLLVSARSKEFAILRAVGATEKQIYKIALSEVISVLIFALISGILLGLGLSYMFNGFFEFMNIFSGSLTYNLPRLVVFPIDTILISMILTATIIIIATILPTRKVANKEIIEETRQV